MPASRHQDHTTSPSADGVSSSAKYSRLSPAASIASRAQRIVTIAKRPSIGRETAAALKVICPTAKAENFYEAGWTLRKDQDAPTDLPDGQIHINKGSDRFVTGRCFLGRREFRRQWPAGG